ncbi:hypothetical protein Q1695_001450 [Nippostrongylus brasiliensis]|nr:hypothetical protein Q1695_001450 [Nippostrongylus brasiliensis]
MGGLTQNTEPAISMTRGNTLRRPKVDSDLTTKMASTMVEAVSKAEMLVLTEYDVGTVPLCCAHLHTTRIRDRIRIQL